VLNQIIMKKANFKYHIIFLLLLGVFSKNAAQDLPKGYKINMEMNVDEKGDVAVIINVKYNAQFWDQVKQNRGNDASVVKNTWKKQFPKYHLTEFDIKSDDMERTSISKFKILGLLNLDENGKWIADLDTKNPDITKVSERQFLLIDEATAQTVKINLPESVSNAKVEKDNFGKAVLTYTAPVSSGGGNIIKYAGILSILAGGFLFFRNRSLKTIVVNSPRNEKIDFRTTRHIDEAIVMPPTPKEDSKPSVNSGSNQNS
jgi:hypothetical protein